MMTEDTQRKYINEWTIVVTVTPRLVGRQQDFQQSGIPDTDEPLHLYLVSHRPRISIDPSSAIFSDNNVHVVLRIQHGGTWDEFPLDAPHRLGSGPLTWHAEWPYENFAISDTTGKIISKGVVANLHAWLPIWPNEAIKHDIVYVGQAFGQDGERTAWDRLKRHETVQKILSETTPDKQVWLTLAAVTDVELMSEIDPRNPVSTSRKEDNEHDSRIIRAIHEGDFKEKQAVALGEAGLIRYFQPKYNDRMKYAFPSRQSVPLESVRELDLHGLIVELNSEDVGSLYGSNTRNHQWLHFAGFAIHQEASRQRTLTLESADWYPGKGLTDAATTKPNSQGQRAGDHDVAHTKPGNDPGS
jgi:hypothetical protein